MIVIFCSRPVALSLALTLRMPLASMSNVTSICGTPRGAGRMPSRMKRPSDLLSCAMARSPWTTWISTRRLVVGRRREDLALAGRDRRVARDQRRRDAAQGLDAQGQRRDVQQQDVLTSPLSTPAWMAAPTATTSSGLTPRCGSLPKNWRTFSMTSGMRVWPPTSTTSSICAADSRRPAAPAWHGLERALDQVADELLQLGAGQRQLQVLGTGGVRGDEGQVDVRLHARSRARSSPSPPLP